MKMILSKIRYKVRKGLAGSAGMVATLRAGKRGTTEYPVSETRTPGRTKPPIQWMAAGISQG